MSYEVFGDDDDGHGDCFTEEQVREHEVDAADKERASIIAYLRRYEYGHMLFSLLESIERGTHNETPASGEICANCNGTGFYDDGVMGCRCECNPVKRAAEESR